MNVCVTLGPDGSVGGGLGRAARVAVGTVSEGSVTSWEEIDVGWDGLHDSGTEASHHARIVRFLREREIGAVVAGGMGEGMRRVLSTMGISLVIAGGAAREAALHGGGEGASGGR